MSARWAVLAASATGRAHARASVGCQDAFAVDEIDGCLVLAVADGASCAPLAAVGAPLAASVAVRVAGSLLRAGVPQDGPHWTVLLRSGLNETLRRFQSAAAAVCRDAGGGGPGDLATTLTLVLAKPPWIGVYAIGDGFVTIRSTDGNLDLLLAPPDGTGRTAGATTFLTSAAALASANRLVARVPDLAGIAVSSDGMDTLMVEYAGARPQWPSETPFGKLFAWAAEPDADEMRLARLLASAGVCQLTEDDKTLVVAVPR